MSRPDPSPSGAAGLLTVLVGLATVLVAERVVIDPALHVGLGWAGALTVVAGTVWRGWRWRRAQGRTRHAERMLWLGHLGVLISLGLFDLRSPAGLAALHIAAESAVATMLTVVWLIALATSLSATLAMERAWLTMPITAAVEPRRLRSAALSAVSLALAVVGVLGMNYAAQRRDLKRDVTYFKTTVPSGTTRQLAAQLEEPVTALLFFAPNSEVLALVQPYFDALAASAPQLRVVVRDQALEPDLARRYRASGNGVVVLIRGTLADRDSGQMAAKQDGGTPPHERFEIGETFAQARRTVRKLDATFQGAFTKLTRPPQRVRFTAGHGERSRDGTTAQLGGTKDGAGGRLTAVYRLLRRFNIGSDGLGVSDGLATAVPKGTTAVLIMGPRRPFLAEEVQSLIRYVASGGRLLLALDPLPHGSDEGKYGDGLGPLLRHFGVRRAPGTTLSAGHHMRSSFSKADRALIYSNSFSSHPTVTTASRNSLRVAVLMARGTSFERVKPAPSGVTVTFPIHSSADFWRDVDGDLERGPKEPLTRLNLMAAVRMTAKSPKNQGSSNSGGADATREGRIVILGDGDFTTDALIQTRGNALVFVDSLRWLMGEANRGGDLSSEEDVPIEHRKQDDQIWFYATTFGLPLLLLLLALLIGRRRRSGGR